MAFRVSFIYACEGDYRRKFSENFWSKSDSAKNALERAIVLGELLLACHGSGTALKQIRIGKTEGGRAVQIQDYSDLSNSNKLADGTTDVGGVAAQLYCLNTATYKTRQWLKGMPDKIFEEGRLVKAGKFNTAQKALCEHLKDAANLWGIRVLDVANTWKAIDNIDGDGVVTVVGHGYDTGNVVRIGRVVSQKRVNGQYRIVKMNDDQFRLLNFKPEDPEFEGLEEGRAKKQDLKIKQIDDAYLGKATTRKVGKG